jgi:hypothetical protein
MGQGDQDLGGDEVAQILTPSRRRAASSPALQTRPFGCHNMHAQAVRQQDEEP